MANERVRFGILGCGRIAARAFAPAVKESANAELAAAASRDLARAQALGAARSYGDYDALLRDDAVEAVYIGTHNGLHEPLALAAFEHGKHVFCEKPLANDAAQCRTMVAAARKSGKLLTEAFMYRYHPRIIAAKRLLDAGAVGDIRTVEASFSFMMKSADDVRFKPEWGGGGLLDVGSYCVNFCRYIFGGLPRRVTALGSFHPQHGVDFALHGVLDFGDGRFGVVSSGFDGGFRSRALICGTEGTMDLPAAFANSNKPTQLVVDAKGQREVHDFEPAALFRLEIEDFARAVRSGSRPMLDAEDGLHNALVMDAMLASAHAGGRAVEVGKP
jgi:predicted dehydrogenase